MATPDASSNREQYTALLQQMSIEQERAAQRWDVACETYCKGWALASANFNRAFEEINRLQTVRENEIRALLSVGLELAIYFLPSVAGRVAVRVAPILSARAQLLARYLSREFAAGAASFATQNPVTTKALGEVRGYGADKVALAAGLIKSKLIDAAAKNYQVQASLPDQNPADYFRSQKALREAEWRDFSAMVAEWNVASDWRRELVPVAHAFFMQNSWLVQAPEVANSLVSMTKIARTLELALWFRWARGLDRNYWEPVHDEYREKMTVGQRDELRREAQRASKYSRRYEDAAAFQPAYTRLLALDMDAFSSMKMSVYTGSGPAAANVVTVDLFRLREAALNRSAHHLGRLIPKERLSAAAIKEVLGAFADDSDDGVFDLGRMVRLALERAAAR
ncbi:MAG: hypothetical protein KA778_03265 [Burkholderiaceae bacterium]|nr:hypothetical protein [Burkholderiaceae bacterium]